MTRFVTPLLVLLAASTIAPAKGDSAAAEREYRIARRLAAERSPEAGPALRRVIELDPDGPLADDALLDLADLTGAPQWPEELGRISEPAAREALAILAEVVDRHSTADRAIEARFRSALLYLEPLAGRDPAHARVELLDIATRPDAGRWAVRARYCRVWLDEQSGETDRAVDAYQRIVLDSGSDPAAVRSSVGLGRIMMRSGLFGISSVWLQAAVDREAPAETGAAELRELAVRGVLRGVTGTSGWTPSSAQRVALGVRGLVGIARSREGGWWVADRKAGTVGRLDTSGRPARQFPFEDLQALTVDPYGRPYVASGSALHRLEGGEAREVGAQGILAPVSAIAVDAGGGVWMLDRKGGRIGRLDAAGSVPEIVWEDREIKLVDIVWDGRRIVGLDTRGAFLVAIAPSGRTERFAESTFAKPVDLAVDPAGQVVVLDARSLEVLVVGPGGEVRARLPLGAAGIERPAALAVGADGSLDVFDEPDGTVVRFP